MAEDGGDGRMYVVLLFITVFMRLALILSLLEFSISGPSSKPITLALWYGLICDSGGKSGLENLAGGSHS